QMARQKMSLMAGAGHFYVQRIDTTGLIDRFDIAQKRLLPGEILSALKAGLGVLHEQTHQMRENGWSAATRQAGFMSDMQRARAAGVLLVFGTDCGAYGMVHGEQYKALYGESQMGSTPMEVIQMATRDAARALGMDGELGTITEGKLADVVIVEADPLADLRNFRHIFRVIKGGSVYDPEEMLAMPAH
ncbi:MAG TPA: amidohydrolase family protein, partial [Bacteroidota bacterium]|nr:amidohydrolase family protein [Bacteroidota bacterium]